MGPSRPIFFRLTDFVTRYFQFNDGNFSAFEVILQSTEDDDSKEIFAKMGFPPLKYVGCDEMMSKVITVFWEIEARG